jgi:hypothetical protein
MKSGLKFIFTICFVLSACMVQADSSLLQVFLQNKVQVYGLAGTPWETELAFDEERARAYMDALHHAYEDILNLPLMEGKLVRQVMQINPVLKERLGMTILSAPRTFYQTDATGLLRCQIEVPLAGKLSLRSALYLAALRPQSHQPLSFMASWSAALDDQSLPVPEFKRIVIDVRDFYYEPSLFPRLFDQSGRLVFQEAMIPKPQRFSRPAIKFSDDIVAARAELKDGEVLTVAAQIDELSARDITIKETDAEVVAGFCRQLVLNPEKETDIVIVFDSEKKIPAGRMEKTKAEKKEKTPVK